MPRKDILGWRIYEWCRPKSLADALQIIGAVVATAWFAFGTDFGQWRPVLPLLAVAFFCFTLWGISLIRQLLNADPTPSSDSPQKSHISPMDAKPPKAVEFTLPSNWMPGFRAGDLGEHDEAGHKIVSEEIHVRVVAKQRLEDVRFEMSVLCRRNDQLETLARIGSVIFAGVVPKDVEQGFLVIRRTYIKIPAALNEKSHVRVRVERDVMIFPENPARIVGALGEQYHFHIAVFHGHSSAERARFTVQTDRKRDFPQSQIIGRDNIEPTMGQSYLCR
jgi:hypothetical protein